MLSNYTDYQNNLLNRLAYCNLKKGTWKPGDDLITVLKMNGNSLAEELEKAGINGLKIVDYENSNASDGFVAIAFENIYTGERGVTFRGTENLNLIGDDVAQMLGDDDERRAQAVNSQIDMIDNLSTAVTGDSLQAQKAIAFYEKNRNKNGNNYLYGHSKGGELASEVFAIYHGEIKQVHVINPQPINWTKLSAEQKAAFKSKKFDAVVIDGDLVWLLGGVPYPVRIVENNKSGDKFFSPHDLTSAKYDENGNAIIEEEPYKDYVLQGVFGLAACIIISGVQIGYTIGSEIWSEIKEAYKFLTETIPETVQKFYDAIVATYEKIKDFIVDVKDNIKDFIVKMGKAVKEWFKSNFNNGYKYASNNPKIVLDTYKLKDYAQRLKSANKRITSIDKRLDSLYWKVGLLDLWNLMQADVLTGYSKRLSKCATYLTETASDFESAEKEFVDNL